MALDATENDSVNHPAHYTRGKIEVWDFIIDQGLNYLRGNAVKYQCRAGDKNPELEEEDIDKAIAFLRREKKRIQDERAN
jgi:phage terminase Nu1 subunit (DNA packaging protein)